MLAWYPYLDKRSKKMTTGEIQFIHKGLTRSSTVARVYVDQFGAPDQLGVKLFDYLTPRHVGFLGDCGIGDVAAQVIALLKTDDVKDIIVGKVYMLAHDDRMTIADWVYTITVEYIDFINARLRLEMHQPFFGGAEKTLLLEKEGKDIVVSVHPESVYPPSDVPSIDDVPSVQGKE